MKWKKVLELFIRGVILLTPLWIVWGFVWLNPLAYADKEVPYYMWNKNVITTEQEREYDVIILGDSLANGAYLPDALSEGTLNLSLGGTTPVEMYYVFEEYIKNNAVPKVCYISFMDEHLQCDACFYDRTLYSQLLSVQQEFTIFKAAKQYNEPSIIVDDYLKKWIMYRTKFPYTYLPSIKLALENSRLETNKYVYENVDLHRGTYISRSLFVVADEEEILRTNFYLNPIFDEYYHKIIDKCIENNIQVRLVSLPLSPLYDYTEEYLLQYNEYYGKLQEKYPMISVLRIEGEYDMEDFSDDKHLNLHGAMQFCEQLKTIYEDDFCSDSEISAKTIEAISDYIVIENDMNAILKWSEIGGFPVLVINQSGYESVDMINSQYGGIHHINYEDVQDANLPEELNEAYGKIVSEHATMIESVPVTFFVLNPEDYSVVLSNGVGY